MEGDTAAVLQHPPANRFFKDILHSLGLVFGDIGTSPIYTLTVIFLLLEPSESHILGVLSLIVWTLVILVTVEYAWLAMSLGKKGEGGTIVLKELLVPLIKSGRKAAWVTLLSYVGVSLLIGDGVITPAISILSAVEGILLIPGLAGTQQHVLVIIAALIALVLFSFQHKGTEKVAGAFGPLMVLWFLSLAVVGAVSIASAPAVLKAVNPCYAAGFLWENSLAGFFVLSEVILCATGGEALYADMGHLGRKPILRAWSLVFFALVINYLGQGAHLVHNPLAKNVLFEMVLHEGRVLYVPFLVLSILATIIASQAMISGMFSIVYQGIATRILPLFKVDYTSSTLRSQIYVGFVNWFLLIAVLFIMFHFRESSQLAAAYGLAVTGTMTITGVMMTAIFYLRGESVKVIISVFVTLVDMVFLASNGYKIPHGGYWSIILSMIPFWIIVIFVNGQKRLYAAMYPLDLEVFLESYKQIFDRLSKIKGSALFFSRITNKVPPYIVHSMLINNIVYEDNIFVSIETLDSPFGVNGFFREDLAQGLRIFEIQVGYMEVFSVEEILRRAGIDERAIFYGIEDITSGNIVWKVFSFVKRLSPTFVQFHKLPSDRLHGVVTRVEM
jgi:KUP system potassium uptake protein